jgi:hypothetical protein
MPIIVRKEMRLMEQEWICDINIYASLVSSLEILAGGAIAIYISRLSILSLG